MRFLRSFSIALPLFLLCAFGCSAQTESNDEAAIKRRVEVYVRNQYEVSPDIGVALGKRTPSDVTGFDKLPITVSRGEKSSTLEFLISKDNKTLVRWVPIDISTDPMAKIDLHGRPVRGADSAKVTIVNFDDFQCPYCSAMHQTLFPDLVKSYGDKLKVIYKDYPLIRIHPWAMHAAIDANCLADQNSDAYWEFADYAHRSQPELNSKEKGNDPLQKLDAKVGEIGKLHKVDAGKLDACVKKQSDTAVQASMAEGDKLGVDSTPTMFINGEKLSGALPAEVLRAAIDRALKAVGETPPAAPSPAKPAGN